mmetsp:Transcript_10476/g.31462  ORF Transcript_10476/g.31462 Transcript_10476/m.31462 type:complete len:225 (+) Transcript_10476:213-887(+)
MLSGRPNVPVPAENHLEMEGGSVGDLASSAVAEADGSYREVLSGDVEAGAAPDTHAAEASDPGTIIEDPPHQHEGRPPRRSGSKGKRGRRGTHPSWDGAGQPGQFSTRNLYVSGLAPHTTGDDLIRTFGRCGTIVSAKAVAAKERPWKCQGYGFVMFESADSAKTAMEMLNGANGMVIQFAKLTQNKRGTTGRRDPTNLYFSNLPLSYDENELEVGSVPGRQAL